MQSQRTIFLNQQEGRIELALQAYTLRQFQTLRRAAAAFGVRHQRLSNRLRKIQFRHKALLNS